MLRIRDVDPGSDFFSSWIPNPRIPDPNCLHPGSRIRITEFKCFNPKKMVSKLNKIWSGLFIPDPGSGCWHLLTFYPSRIQGSKRHRIPDPDPQHWFPFAWSILTFFIDTLFLPVSLLKIGYLIFYLVSIIFFYCYAVVLPGWYIDFVDPTRWIIWYHRFMTVCFLTILFSIFSSHLVFMYFLVHNGRNRTAKLFTLFLCTDCIVRWFFWNAVKN